MAELCLEKLFAMKIIYAYRWSNSHPGLIQKVEDFVYAWMSSEENSSYSNAVFYGIICGNARKFTEIEEGEEKQMKDIRYLIKCHLMRSGSEVHVYLLHY